MGNIEERATIAFDKPLFGEEVEKLLKHLANEIEGCRLNYCLEHQGILVNDPNSESMDISSEKYVSGISASISCFRKKTDKPGELRMGTFEGVREPLDYKNRMYSGRLIYGFRFFVSPGYDESDVPESELSLMDEVREKINEFFA